MNEEPTLKELLETLRKRATEFKTCRLYYEEWSRLSDLSVQAGNGRVAHYLETKNLHKVGSNFWLDARDLHALVKHGESCIQTIARHKFTRKVK